MKSAKIAVAVALLAAAPASAASLLTNGDFETPTATGTPFVTYNNTPPASFGWSISSDLTPNSAATTGLLGVDHIDTYWDGAGAGPDRSIDIDGVSVLSQSFATIIGETYTLEFAYSRNFNNGANPISIDLLIEGLGTLLSDRVTSTQSVTQANMNWQVYTNSFVADGTTATLSFIGLQTGTSFERSLGFALDEVSVVPATIPLPAGLPLLLAGLGGLALLKRPRRPKPDLSGMRGVG